MRFPVSAPAGVGAVTEVGGRFIDPDASRDVSALEEGPSH